MDKTGGSAFPHSDGAPNVHGEWSWLENTGMTLRDYFAAMALQGFCCGGTQGDPIDSISSLSYKMADAMLAERAK